MYPHQHDDHMRKVKNLARDLLEISNKSRANSRSHSANSRRAQSRSHSANSRASSHAGHRQTYRRNQKGKVNKKNGNRKQYMPAWRTPSWRGFAMPQFAPYELTNDKLRKTRAVYDVYNLPRCTAGVVSDHTYNAFQTHTISGELPKTIVAHHVKATKRIKEVVNADGQTITTIPYESYALDSIENTFLLYVSDAEKGSAGSAGSAGSTAMEEDDMLDPIFGPIDGAVTAFDSRKYVLYFSMADSVFSKKQPGKLVPAFLTMCVPCTIEKEKAKNIIDKEKLGIVKPSTTQAGVEVILDKPVATREELIEKYKPMISCHSFCSECKLSAEQIRKFDLRLKSIFEGVYLVKRVTESTGAVQIVQSPRIKIGARMGEQVLANKIRNFRMSMVFQMPYKSAQMRITILKMCREVIFSIVHKVKDTKYQTAMLNLKFLTARQEEEKNPWTAILAKECMLKLLQCYYNCYYHRIMHFMITPDRVRALTDGIFTWKKYFEMKYAIPKKSVWDAMERRRENVEIPIDERIYVRDDESTDEEGDDKTRDRSTPSQIRVRGRAMSEEPPSPTYAPPKAQ